jgi:hypothetical protein
MVCDVVVVGTRASFSVREQLERLQAAKNEVQSALDATTAALSEVRLSRLRSSLHVCVCFARNARPVGVHCVYAHTPYLLVRVVQASYHSSVPMKHVMGVSFAAQLLT